MEIRFQTKEESNKQQQQQDFLKLSKVERFYSFLRLSERISRFPVKNKADKNKDNFVIVIKSE
ncbi:hypothetical protein BC749_101363 [Flavobacterium araucananum]|uniref:Uncharacterized protein n=1 Tax=Flavobacterium araucananum TaxID=946678 RepID=A0A227P6H2_9FLAO|nr:hypothetical protein [Flavobacterium araucananum]OXG05509.1 hypothetical protein B0A64_12415 [Flavobacterium araucananum]PWK02299.1 hypothetical protein BC749_101363 [Flavobacterium araucananum]